MQDNGTMKLADWLKRNNMNQAELARRLGIAESTLSRIRRGKNTPGLDIAMKIEEYTRSEVSLQDLLRAAGKGDSA